MIYGIKGRLLAAALLLATAVQAQRHEFSARQAADYARQNNVQVKNALLDVQIQ